MELVTYIAVGELVQAAAHQRGLIGAIPFHTFTPIDWEQHTRRIHMQELQFTRAQSEIVSDLCHSHGLEPEQISFEIDSLKPIFDYEAVCALSLKLTDIRSIDCELKPVDPMRHLTSVATCTVILPDGRTRTVEESADVEEFVNGRKLETKRDADGMAQNRAVRRGIRSVGIDLFKAHKNWVRNGRPVAGTIDVNPRQPIFNEIHALAGEVDLIVDGDRKEYERFIGEMFPGITSSKDLNDIEIRQFLAALRQMRHVKEISGRRNAA